jgi:hypothetical protein
MSGHTAGPWTVETPPPNAYTDADIHLDEDIAFWIAETRTAGEVLGHVNRTARGEQQANARLIAAAPELLTACRVALDQYGPDGDHISEPARSILLAAIAKAEGRAS